MPTIIRVEDLQPVTQLTTGAIFYTSQSGTPFNTTLSDIINSVGGSISVNNIVYITGNQIVSGAKIFLDGNGVLALTTSNRQLQAGGFGVLNWGNNTISDGLGNKSIFWSGRTLVSSGGANTSLDWNNRILSGNWNINGTGIATSIELFQTGSNLQNQINGILATGIGGVNKAVTGLNGLTGSVSLTGQGNITITKNGQIINISGNSSLANVPSVNFTTNVNWLNANTFYCSINSSSNTITFSNTTDGQSIVVQTSVTTSGIITWPSNIKWPNNLVPIPTSGAIDVYTFIQINTGIFATVIQNYPL